MRLVYDSANEFEAKTWEYLPGYYNVSNDDIEVESRTAKKGVEPEAVTLAQLGGRAYAFIALERVGGIMVYDVTDPAQASFVNYVNTRDFNGETAGDVAPEGLAVVQSGSAALLLAAFEVSGTVASYELAAVQSEPEDPGTEDPGTPPEEPGTPDGQEPDTTPSDDGGQTTAGGCGSAIAGGSLALVVAAIGIAVTAVILVRRKKGL